MNDEFLPFSRPSISREAINEVVACLESGWISTGPRVLQFTEKLQHYFNAPFVMPLLSATAGLHLTLLALDLHPGDEVITTPLTFVATLNTIVLAGGKPILVDIDPTTLNMDLNQVEEVISEKTRAIVPVHFAGCPVDMDYLLQIAERDNIRVIEDAAHAMGTSYKDKRIGSFGDTQIFSFHPNKNMTTGEGGCVVTRDAELAEKIKILCFHGKVKTSKQAYDIVSPGFKYNMMDMQAALGLHQLNDLEKFIERRIELASRYQEALADWPQWKLPVLPTFSCRHSWYIYTPLINEHETQITRDEFIQRMLENNIGIGLHFPAAHLLQFYREQFGFQPGDFPHAEYVGNRIVSLPLFPAMTDTQHDRVLDVMYQIFHA